MIIKLEGDKKNHIENYLINAIEVNKVKIIIIGNSIHIKNAFENQNYLLLNIYELISSNVSIRIILFLSNYSTSFKKIEIKSILYKNINFHLFETKYFLNFDNSTIFENISIHDKAINNIKSSILKLIPNCFIKGLHSFFISFTETINLNDYNNNVIFEN